MPVETDPEKIARLEQELRERDATIVELGRAVEELRGQLEEWKRGHRVRDHRRRSKAAKAAKAAAARAAGEPERKSGRPKGHEGAGRPGPEHVDCTEECRAEGSCPCGGALADVGVGRRHRVEELVINVEVTEYQCMCQRCEQCGAVTEPATVEVRSRLLQAPVIVVDETGWWQDGKRAWLSAAVTTELSVFHISPHRDRAAFEAMVPAYYSGIIATDAYGVYDHLPETRHPQCWAHALRTARDIAEIHNDAQDAAMWDGIGAFIAAAKAHRDVAWPSPDTRAAAQAAFETVLVAGRAARHAKLITLGARLDRQRIRYLLCLDDKSVPLTTNQVERDLRGAIPVRKLSFGTRNPRGSLQWAEGATLAKTLRKQRKHLVEYIPRALAAVTLGAQLPSVFDIPP